MYYPNSIEDQCYDQNHIDRVIAEIKINIPDYLEKFIESEGGDSVSDDKLEKLAEAFGSTSGVKKKKKNKKEILKRLIEEATENFEKDRDYYKEHLHLESLEEYGEDVNSFKNTILRNQIPIIRKTLQNKIAKELDKYRSAFKKSQPGDLYIVVKNIIKLAEQRRSEWYIPTEFENISSCKELNYFAFDEEGFTAYGVIGGGIKSHFIYKLHPHIFPNRSREALWALWYLSGKKKFNCKEDSQFLMINAGEGTTQQNYFYPYALFAFYALEISRFLRENLKLYDIIISENNRFIIVDVFLSFVSRQHQQEIDLLKQKSENYQYDY